MSSMGASAVELRALSRAVALAGTGRSTVLPNPVVGCVILDPAGVLIGEGAHQRAGGPHAEVLALAAAGERAPGGTAVVTLEPCNHTGRTPPCVDALLVARIARVVVGVRDPNPVAAGGLERLAAAGVEVVDASATAEGQAAADVNRVWLTAVTQGRPYVTAKVGMTIDGRVAAADGTSRWISSAESRADAHRFRAEVDTMMVGVGTVLGDDPLLTVRPADGSTPERQPLRVVVDSAGRTPAGAKIRGDDAQTLIATSEQFPGSDGRVDLVALLRHLGSLGLRHVLLEGGPTLHASAFDAGVVDEFVCYLAPLVLGAGRIAVDGGTVETLSAAHGFELVDVTRIGPDVRLTWRVRRVS